MNSEKNTYVFLDLIPNGDNLFNIYPAALGIIPWKGVLKKILVNVYSV
jgi:hypothetical protein